MVKVFIYKEYDLIEKINTILDKATDEIKYNRAYWILKHGLLDLRENIRNAAEVMIEDK